MEIWKVGDVEISRVVEVILPTPASGLIPEANPAALEDIAHWLRPHFLDAEGNLLLSIHAFAIRSGDTRIVVDTCLGNGKPRPLPEWGELQTTFLSDLERAGFPREGVDRVVCTHLHFDHVGWNTLREGDAWVPTFNRARYLVADREWGYWRNEDDPWAPEAKHDSILPVFEAGLVDLVEADHVITEEVKLMPTPGHTPGHVSVAIASRGEEAIITGDLFHHPLQLAHPGWRDVADVDAQQACATRSAFLERYADRPVLILGTHFAAPCGGHIVRDGSSFRFQV